MKSTIFTDAQASPQMFLWNKPVDASALAAWVESKRWTVPSDLIEFWATTGGGEIFESEVFLRPLVSEDPLGSVEQVTNWCRDRGMSEELIVFHEGLGFTAVDSSDGTYVSLDSKCRVGTRYRSLDDWYVGFLRAEYGARYGLAPL